MIYCHGVIEKHWFVGIVWLCCSSVCSWWVAKRCQDSKTLQLPIFTQSWLSIVQPFKETSQALIWSQAASVFFLFSYSHSQKIWHVSSHLFLQTMASHSPPPLRACPWTLMVLLWKPYPAVFISSSLLIYGTKTISDPIKVVLML